MFDTMTITKTVAGLCAALLFFLVAKTAAEAIYMPGHGDEHAQAVYPLPEEEGHGASDAAAPAEEVDIMALYAQADAAAGEALWRNCRACHKLDGTNATGPHLDGVFGRPIDAVEGYNYSGALAVLGDTWTVEALNTFLANPREAAPGTRMNFRGLSNLQDRLNLIKFLESVSQ